MNERAAGIKEKKILRVVGLADSVPFNRADPMDPANRRISIIVMSKQAADAAIGDGPSFDVNAMRKAAPAAAAAPVPAPTAVTPTAVTSTEVAPSAVAPSAVAPTAALTLASVPVRR